LLIDNNAMAAIPTDRIDSRFLYHFLRTIDFYRLASTTTVPSLRKSDVAKIVVPLPSSEDQRRIAAVLDQAEALRAKRRAAIALLDTLTQSIFLDMFGDPATNPKRWDIAVVKDVAEVQGGLQVTSARNSHPRQIPYLRVANVYRGCLDLRETKQIRATDAEVARTLLRKDDFLVVEGHGNPSEVGRGALWDGSIAECVHQNHLIRVRFNADRIVPRFGSEFLNSVGGRSFLLRAGNTTSGLNTISVADVRATPILVPPLELQRMFERRAAAVEMLRARHHKFSRELDALFASLQHRAFRGEL
jgi:type I restriction enzyme S subunit